VVDDEQHAYFEDQLHTVGAFPRTLVQDVTADEVWELTAQPGVVLLRYR